MAMQIKLFVVVVVIVCKIYVLLLFSKCSRTSVKKCRVVSPTIESLSTDVFEPRTSTGSLQCMFFLLARFHARPMSYKALILAFTT